MRSVSQVPDECPLLPNPPRDVPELWLEPEELPDECDEDPEYPRPER
jgi:hypothetical protein